MIGLFRPSNGQTGGFWLWGVSNARTRQRWITESAFCNGLPETKARAMPTVWLLSAISTSRARRLVSRVRTDFVAETRNLLGEFGSRVITAGWCD